VLPHTLVKVLNHLIDELPPGPSPARIELRAARSAVCRAFRIPSPEAPADPIALEHELNPEEDIDAP